MRGPTLHPAILYTRPSGEVMFDANRVTALNCLNCARLSEAATLSPAPLCVQKLTERRGSHEEFQELFHLAGNTPMRAYREPVFKKTHGYLFSMKTRVFCSLYIDSKCFLQSILYWNEIDACAGQDGRFI